MRPDFSKLRHFWLLWALYSLVVAILLFAIFELGIFALSRQPQWLRSWGPKRALRSVYLQRREVIQASAQCARWDEELSYTLRPGQCRFSNVEFSTEYRINQTGLRDDRSSLVGPQVIVLGDSHAMGWGVEQEETFAQLLERSTDLRVLNAAISSYGTAREMLMLRRLDTSQLRLLVVQYGQNDFHENGSFLGTDGESKRQPPKRFKRSVDQHLKNRRYRLGQYLLSCLRLEDRPVSLLPAPHRDGEEAKRFLDVLLGATALPPKVPVLVFEINGYARNDRGFGNALRRLLAERQIERQIEVMNVADFLTTEHYHVLDDHLAAAGHRQLATAIEGRLGSLLASADSEPGGQQPD